MVLILNSSRSNAHLVLFTVEFFFNYSMKGLYEKSFRRYRCPLHFARTKQAHPLVPSLICVVEGYPLVATGSVRKIAPCGLTLPKQLTILALQGLGCQPKRNGVVYLEMATQVVHQVMRLEIRGPGQVTALL